MKDSNDDELKKKNLISLPDIPIKNNKNKMIVKNFE